MKRLWLLNLALLAIVAALAAVAIYRPGRKPPAAPLTSLTAASVTSVRIVRPDQPALQLARDGDAWRVESPVKARANVFNVEALLHVASMPAQPLADAGRPESYGMTKPQAQLWLNDEEFTFGAFHPFNNLQYVLHRGAVYLLPLQAFGAVARPWTDYLDTNLLEPQRRLDRLQLPGFSLAFQNGSWVRTPEDRPLSGDAINDFVARWQHASALSVDRYSGKPPLAWVVLHFAGETALLRIGIIERQPEFVLYRKDEGLEYHFPEDVGNSLLKLSSK